MKNKFILNAVKILKRWISPSNLMGHKHFLVVSTTALGDTLWATPALESLKKSWPDSKITVLTSTIGEEVLRHNPWIDQIIILKEPIVLNFFSLWKRLKNENIQEIAILHTSQRLILPLCSLLGAYRVIGTTGINKGLDELLTDPVPPIYEHEIARRLRLIELLGAHSFNEELTFFLQPHEKIFPQNPRLVVTLHPGSKDGFKRWPREHFIQLGVALSNAGVQIFISGTTDEKPLLEQITDSIPGAILCDLTWTLRQFAAHLTTCKLLISNDTGPVHLASALKIPVIALYSPTDPALCGPHKAKKAVIIAKPPTCQPCLKRKCQRPFCLLQIGPDEVITQALELLQKW